MDYKTKPIKRCDIRSLAKVFRHLFGVPHTGAFPVLLSLERVGDVFKGSSFVALSDDEFPANTMARCVDIGNENYRIEIRESVYNGAYENNVGAYLGFICHEICHLFLFKIGFKPIFERSFGDKELRAFESVEWQAKALCGEVMIPYEESEGLSCKEIVRKYHVSKECARFRMKLH